MPMKYEELTIAVGKQAFLEQRNPISALPIFSEDVIALLDALSRRLRRLPERKEFPDIASLAFWCRHSHMSRLAQPYAGELRLGKGLAFHIAPSNVPLHFVYTLAAGLLSGCANAVRLPSRTFLQAQIVCRELNALLHTDFTALLPYVFCFRCNHQNPVLGKLSACCDARVIWGGNETIAQIRKLPLKARAVELPFADRYSIAVIHAKAFLQSDDQYNVVERFCQDAYFSGQWACTSPRAVFWLGEAEACGTARAVFWGFAETIAKRKYPVTPVGAVKKREQICLLAAAYPQVRLCPGENHAVRVWVPELRAEMMDFWTGEGLFFECCGSKLDALLPVLTERCQTVTSFGVEPEEWQSFLLRTRPKGIDRITPFGSSMQFSLHWDGIDLIRSMSRSIVI